MTAGRLPHSQVSGTAPSLRGAHTRAHTRPRAHLGEHTTCSREVLKLNDTTEEIRLSYRDGDGQREQWSASTDDSGCNTGRPSGASTWTPGGSDLDAGAGPGKGAQEKKGVTPNACPHSLCNPRGAQVPGAETRAVAPTRQPGAPPALGVSNSGEQVRALPGGASPVAGEGAAGPQGMEGEAGNGERTGESDLEN